MTTTTGADKATDELLPCPFCGGSDAFVERSDYSSAYVQCDSRIDDYSVCMAHGPLAVQDDDDEEVPGKAGAIRAWNHRAALAARQSPAEAEEELIDKLGKLLSGVAIALKGPQPALTRWSYHDLPEIAAKVMIELEIYRQQADRQVPTEAPKEPRISDSDRLEWMMEKGAHIAWGKDGEQCRVFARDSDGKNELVIRWIPEAWAHCPREAIDAAIAQEKA